MKTLRLITVAVLLCGGLSRAAETPPPAGYTVVKKTDFGRIMTVSKDKPTTVATAIDAVLDDLDDYFDDDYTCSGAFENQTDHKSGFAAIQAKYNGQPVRGFVSATLTDKGARGLVIFCNNNAPPTAWGDLTGKAAAPAARRRTGRRQSTAGRPV